MKSTAPESLQAAIKLVLALTDEIATSTQLLTDTTSRRQSLENSCDLSDETALAEITRLQVLEALLPRRIANLQVLLAEAQEALLQASHDFICQHLGPRVRALINRAKDKTSAELRPHFSDANVLENAVAKSSLVVELEGFSNYATVRHESVKGRVTYARQLLRTWDDCDAREAKL